MHGDAFDNRLNDWRPESPAKTDPSTPQGQGGSTPGSLASHALEEQRAAARAEAQRRVAANVSFVASSPELGGSPGDGEAVSLWVDEEGRVAADTQDGQSIYLPSEFADCAGSVLTEEGLDATAWTVGPETVHPSVPLNKNFAWCPWTKTYVPIGREMRIQRLWCWQAYNLNWWTGFLFVIGSVGFFTGAIAACYHYPGEGHRSYKIWSELVPYLGGGLCFVAGALTLTIQTYQLVDWDTKRDKPEFQKLLEGSFTGGDDAHRLMPGMVVLPEEPPPTRSFLGVWEVVPAPGEGLMDQPVTLPRRESSGQRVMRKVAAEEEFQRLWLEYDPWTRRQHVVELAGSFAIFLGTLFYKLGLFTDLFMTIYGEERLPKDLAYLLTVTSLQAGSTLFVFGGYMLLASYEQSWMPWKMFQMHPLRASLAWWIVMLNMIGSLLFLLGSLPLHVVAPSPAISDTYVQNFFGWALGSVCFFIQSWLMVIEVACSEDDVLPEQI
eukprot:CAMPEP_0177785494 /NCGR_PEP_ID=MMETSP0491_2-20121128/20357_1 /TAXON_ID=63592 /ORGANISM="Tetraselmis chuii, Strain PLY429" /LENGTH=493 /DNA_ID=CAMNT_0019306517 /DNA_START=30 /DNA_END=1511 /DNA_ORIENTATION=+